MKQAQKVAAPRPSMERQGSVNKSDLFQDERAKRNSINNILSSMGKDGTGEIDISDIVDLVEKQRDTHLAKQRSMSE